MININLPYIFLLTLIIIFFLIHLVRFRNKIGFTKRKNTLILALVVLFASFLGVYDEPTLWGLLSLFLSVILLIFSIILLRVIDYIVNKDKSGQISVLGKEALRKAFHLVAFIVFVPIDVLYSALYGAVESALILLNEINGFSISIFELGSLPPAVFLSELLLSLVLAFLFSSTLLELLRIHIGFNVFPEVLTRPDERNQFAGEIFIAVSFLFVSVYANWRVFSAVAASSLIGDGLGAIIGRWKGKHLIREGRSVEGTIAEFLGAFLSATYFCGFVSGFLAAILIVISDIFITHKIDDNLLFPLVAYLGIMLWYIV